MHSFYEYTRFTTLPSDLLFFDIKRFKAGVENYLWIQDQDNGAGGYWGAADSVETAHGSSLKISALYDGAYSAGSETNALDITSDDVVFVSPKGLITTPFRDQTKEVAFDENGQLEIQLNGVGRNETVQLVTQSGMPPYMEISSVDVIGGGVFPRFTLPDGLTFDGKDQWLMKGQEYVVEQLTDEQQSAIDAGNEVLWVNSYTGSAFGAIPITALGQTVELPGGRGQATLTEAGELVYKLSIPGLTNNQIIHWQSSAADPNGHIRPADAEITKFRGIENLNDDDDFVFSLESGLPDFSESSVSDIHAVSLAVVTNEHGEFGFVRTSGNDSGDFTLDDSIAFQQQLIETMSSHAPMINTIRLHISPSLIDYVDGDGTSFIDLFRAFGDAGYKIIPHLTSPLFSSTNASVDFASTGLDASLFGTDFSDLSDENKDIVEGKILEAGGAIFASNTSQLTADQNASIELDQDLRIHKPVSTNSDGSFTAAVIPNVPESWGSASSEFDPIDYTVNSWSRFTDIVNADPDLRDAIFGYQIWNEPMAYDWDSSAQAQIFADDIAEVFSRVGTGWGDKRILVPGLNSDKQFEILASDPDLDGVTPLDQIRNTIGDKLIWSSHVYVRDDDATYEAYDEDYLRSKFEAQHRVLEGDDIVVTELNFDADISVEGYSESEAQIAANFQGAPIWQHWSLLDPISGPQQHKYVYARFSEWYAEQGIGTGWYAPTGVDADLFSDARESSQKEERDSLAFALNMWSADEQTATDGSMGGDDILAASSAGVPDDRGFVAFGYGGDDIVRHEQTAVSHHSERTYFVDGAGVDTYYGGSYITTFNVTEAGQNYAYANGDGRNTVRFAEDVIQGLTINLTDMSQSTGIAKDNFFEGFRTLQATGHDDIIIADNDWNIIRGGAGDDIIIDQGNANGGALQTKMFGDGGADIFRFEGRDGIAERIYNFEIGVDKIDLSALGVTGMDELTISYKANGYGSIVDAEGEAINLVGSWVSHAASDLNAQLTANDFIFA